jgi:hypothetical protein
LPTKWATTCTIGSSIYKNLKLKKEENEHCTRSLIYSGYGSMSARRADRKPFAKLRSVRKAVRNKGTALGKRFSRQDKVADDLLYDSFRSKGSILKVSNAYLFEKPQSRVKKMPRFLGSLDCISNNNAYYSSSTCYLDYISNI